MEQSVFERVQRAYLTLKYIDWDAEGVTDAVEATVENLEEALELLRTSVRNLGCAALFDVSDEEQRQHIRHLEAKARESESARILDEWQEMLDNKELVAEALQDPGAVHAAFERAQEIFREEWADKVVLDLENK